MKILLIIIIICLSIISCDIKAQKKCNLHITNRSFQKIDSIKITSYGLTVVVTGLSPQKNIEKQVTINYSEKQEGAFLATIYIKDSIKAQATFGYYANGKDIKTKYSIEILEDLSIREN